MSGHTNANLLVNWSARSRGAFLIASACVAACAGLAISTAEPASAATANATLSPDTQEDPYAELPAVLRVDAVIRDFRAKGDTGGHPDFQAFSGSTTVGLVNNTLDPDGKPSVASLRGWNISREFTDNQGRNINPALYDASRGDRAGSLSNGGTGNGLHSVTSFNQWYRDVPGVNLARTITLELQRVPNTNRYVFDSATHQPYASKGGFFPINDDLYGNYQSGKNFHFTTEIDTEFVYDEGAGQVFKFTGDDDVWVYIDGRLVIDLGGLHSRKEQFLDADRLGWLEDGETYSLKIFHAERRTSESNFRVETTMRLRSVELPSVAGLHD